MESGVVLYFREPGAKIISRLCLRKKYTKLPIYYIQAFEGDLEMRDPDT